MSRKPNSKQRAIMRMIESEVSYWQTTNDLSSPSLHTSILAEAQNIDWTNERGEYKELSDAEAQQIEAVLMPVLMLVRELRDQ